MRAQSKPPINGSFPLDHFRECRDLVAVYLECLKEHNSLSKRCRSLQKSYLQCRMDNGLMEKQSMEELGFVEELEWDSEKKENEQILERIRARKERARLAFEKDQN